VDKEEGIAVPSNIEFAYASFLIRLWRQTGPLNPDHPGDWQSEVEHIQTGQHWKFTTLEALLDFMRRQADEMEGIKKFVSGFE
jgi:hypothetical protein